MSQHTQREIIFIRRLYQTENPTLPKSILKFGDSGQEVALLQSALKILGFNIGTSDGIFGPRTEAGVKQFQSSFLDLEITGVFDHRTRQRLEEKLRQ